MMGIYWHREKKPQPGNRVPAWYFKDTRTDHTHMRVVWLDTLSAMDMGWHYIVIGPSHVKRIISPIGYDLPEQAKQAARVWWANNRETHLKQFEE